MTEKNADLASAAANVKYMRALYSGTYSNFLPQLSANLSYTDSSSQGGIATPGSLTQSTTVQKQYSESLQLNQSIFNGFADVGKVQQGKANLAAAQAQLALQKVTLSANLKTAFAQLLFEQKSIELTEAILNRQQVNLRMIDLRFKGGNENKGSLLFQQATVAQAQYQHDHAVRQLHNAIKQLGALWGDSDIKDLVVVGELAGHAPSTQPNFEELAARHPNHVNFVQQLVAAEAGVKVADGGWYPNLNLVASTGDVGPSWPPDNNRWSAGLSLSFPFFPGTSQIYAAQGARAQKLQAEYAKASTDFKLIAGLESAYEALLDAMAQVHVSEGFQLAAQARSRIANGKYNTGLMTFEDWTVIDQDLVNREQTLLQSQLNAMQAEATWENAEGIGDIP